MKIIEILLGFILSIILIILFYYYLGWCVEKIDKKQETENIESELLKSLMQEQNPSNETFLINFNHLIRDSYKKINFIITSFSIPKDS